MDKFSFGTDWFTGNRILPLTIDGVELDPEEELMPRKDYGPIGPRKKVVENNENVGLIFNWVSDFIRPGGGVENDDFFKLGLAPGTPKSRVPVAPELKLSSPGTFGAIGYSAGSTASSSSGYSTSQSMNEYEPPSPPAGVYTQFPPSQHVQYALLRQVQQQPLPPPLPQLKKMTAKESSNQADMKEFAEQYGFCGKIRPNHYYRPRKGKYFKKFEES